MKFANFVCFCITRGKALKFPAVLMNFPNSEVCLIGEWSIQDLQHVILDFNLLLKYDLECFFLTSECSLQCFGIRLEVHSDDLR